MHREKIALLLLISIPMLYHGAAAQSTVNEDNPRTATVSGQVTLNGEPLGGITVRLFPERLAASGDPRSRHQAITDERGNYHITGIITGSYSVSVLPDEFLITGGLPTDLQRKMVSVVDGEKVERFDLVLKRGGIISGKVTDSSGNPLIRQKIELTKIGDDGKPQPFPINHAGPKMTDARGVYRIIRVPEGRYLVSAGINLAERMGTPIPGDVYYSQTFHPNVSDPFQALAVVVSEGSETTGIDILIADARKTFDIKGRVVSAETGDPVDGVEIFYSPYREGGGVVGPRSRGARSNPAGEFLFQALLPGKYVLYPQTDAGREYFSEPVICEITDNGLDGVEVKLQRGSSVSGAIVIDGADDPAIPAKLSHVRIGGFSKNRQPVILPREGAQISVDGGFRITGLRPGKIYFSLVSDLKDGGFSIKRIERDGALVEDGLEIGPGENLSNIRVVAGYGNLTLRGEVKVIAGSLPPHIGIYVNLIRVNQSKTSNIMGAFADGRGQFIFQNLIPGDYEVHLVGTNFQPAEPRDKSLLKLIYNTRQKVSLVTHNQPMVTLVIDLSQKERNQ